MYNAMTKMSITPIEMLKMLITAICQEEGQSLTSGPESFNFVLPYAFSSIFHAPILLRNAIL